MKKLSKKSMKIVALGISFLMLLNSISVSVLAADSIEPYYFNSKNNNITATAMDNSIVINPTQAKFTAENQELKDNADYNSKVLEVKPNTTFSYIVNVPKDGGYYIKTDYFIPTREMGDLALSLKINGEYQFYDSRNLVLESAWKDKSDEYIKDSFGNDLYPEPERVYRWQSKQFNSTIYNFSYPYVFLLKAGENILEFTNNEVGYLQGDIEISGKMKEISFDEYCKKLPKSDVNTSNPIVIQAEKYSEKTKSYIRGEKGNDYNTTPYDPTIKQISEISGETWSKPNEGVTYKFNIEQTGIYYITLKYTQGTKNDMPSFKQVMVDYEYPCDEMRDYAFVYTKKKPKNETLNINGENIPFYFEKGEHTISLLSTAQSVYETYENLLKIINDANDMALQIKVITGNKTDKNRDWDIEEYLPNLKNDLVEFANIIDSEYEKLSQLASKDNVVLISNLKIASARLMDFSKNLNFLVNNLDQFTQGSGSVTEYISLLLPELLGQPISIDEITISGSADDVALATKGLLYGAWQETRKFVLSFFVKTEEPPTDSKDILDVWANRSTAHLDVLKEMTSTFEKESNSQVNLSLMPDEQKLLLAVSSGNAPDAVIGMSNYRPFDFAMRGAMYDLRNFDDFGDTIKSMHPEMLIPFVVDDSCYALPETANFQVLFYRKDIIESLKLEIPQTWDDVIALLPTLSRYGMDFNTLIANVGGIKHFGATVPFIQQYEGELYSQDGTRAELGDPNTVEAFKLMTDLYTKYSLPENIPNFFNNFKKGITPMGISDMNTYVLLKNAAPEIAGQWGIAPSVGVKGANGEINRYQASVASAVGIMRDANNKPLAWDYLKWYMSDDVQINYANNLQLRYGPEYIWNTANLTALKKSSAFTPEDMKVINEQLMQTKEIPRNPAYFAVERELSNAWNATVFDGVSPRTALDQAITRSNREITKKLKEFGYLDNNGNIVKEFKMATTETIERFINE